MAELPLIFVSGLVGSSHCIGMCGPFAAILGSQTQGWKQNIGWQLLYSIGRIFTYTALGAMAGYGGQRLVGLKWGGINATAVLAIVAGLLLIREGLVTVGIWKRRFGMFGSQLCPSGGMLRALLQQGNRSGIFLAGIATGFLPCGLVYAFLLTAARTSNLAMGALTMTCFGLGTVPLMVTTGVSASAVPLSWRETHVLGGRMVRCADGTALPLPRLRLPDSHRPSRMPLLSRIDRSTGCGLPQGLNKLPKPPALESTRIRLFSGRWARDEPFLACMLLAAHQRTSREFADVSDWGADR